MSFTGILALLLMALFGVSLYFVIRGIKTKNIKLYKNLKAEAEDKGLRPATLALRKMLESPFPVALIVGSRTEEQMRLTLEAAE